MEPFDREDFASWPGADRMAMWGIGMRPATAPRRESTRPKVGQIGAPGSLRPSPDAPRRASRRACPGSRFAAIELIPSGRIVL